MSRDAEIGELYPALTMQAIAQRFGISRQRVQQILKAQGYEMGHRPPPSPLAGRFWPKVLKSEGCWEWQGSRFPTGYGHMNVSGTQGYAHRVSWELHNGNIPSGMQVCHHCDNPPCVRPDHLFLGTPLDNARDRDRKGRGANGAVNDAVLVRQLLEEWRESA